MNSLFQIAEVDRGEIRQVMCSAGLTYWRLARWEFSVQSC
nr:hypothetical protein [Synechococcus sp. RS9916]